MQRRLQDIAFDKGFKKVANPHKYAVMWASGIYRHVNAIMRSFPIDVQFIKFPNLFFFAKNFINYFYTHGLSKKDLRTKGFRYLYRGIDSTFSPSIEYEDTGFIATSWQEDIANKFAISSVGKGTVMRFRVSQLPDKVPFIIIDETIDEFYHESEVLMLPGCITLDLVSMQATNQVLRAGYQLSDKIALYNRDSMIGGGHLTYSDVELAGKRIVYYRAIEKRDPEIMAIQHIPVKQTHIDVFLKTDFIKIQDFFEKATNIIPEYQRLRKHLKTAKYNSKTDRLISRMMSYDVQQALYNPQTKEVETMYLFVPKEMTKEFADVSREAECKKFIIENML
jgi:hypothetical protein